MARERCSSWVQKPMLALKSLDSSLKYANYHNAVVGEKLKISHCLWDVLVRIESPHRFSKFNSVWILLTFSPTNTPVNSPTCQLASGPICLIFSTNFNTMSAVFVNQSLVRPKNSILAEVYFGAKMGLACEWGKMNVYPKRTPFAPDLGVFAAKYGAICR